MKTVGCVNELGGDAHLIAALAHRALDHVHYAKLPRDLGHFEPFSLERE